MRRFWIDIYIAFGHKLFCFSWTGRDTYLEVQDVLVFNLGVMVNAGRNLE